jgi:two-component system response regulator GlrR
MQKSPAPFHRVLLCGRERDALAPLAQALQSLPGPALRPVLAGLDEPGPQADLHLQLVPAADLAPALQQLGARRAAGLGGSALVAAQGLPEPALASLFAAGAQDFVSWPAPGEELAIRVHRALGLGADEPAVDVRPVLPALRDLIGDSPAFLQQVARVPLLARYDASVLILGDTGTGKEVCAQAVHYLSARAGRPWVAVNCGAIPAELVEAELFGHVKGAYTHAHAARSGLIREAEGGTLFLDEIDSLPYAAQASLLRFLQDKEYRPVGASTPQHADVRVIAASNRRLSQLALRGGFRQDLLFRLNVLTLHLPPLCERRSDIPQLALHFLRAAGREWRKPAPALSPGALKKLLAHDWPGNVRELKNAMQRALLMSPGPVLGAADIDLDDGSDAAAAAALPSDDESFRSAKARVVEHFERAYIEHLLASHAGNVTHAAHAAKKNRRAFFELMRKYRIEPDSFRPD